MSATPHASIPVTYSVPQQFGVSAILALTTLFAFVFAILRGFNAPWLLYLFFGTLAICICLAQMFFGRVPRLSSIVAGAVLLPFWVLVAAFLDERVQDSLLSIGTIEDLIAAFPPLLVVGGSLGLAGGFLGYLTGTLLAGFFLVLDLAHSKGNNSPVVPRDEVFTSRSETTTSTGHAKPPPQIPLAAEVGEPPS